MLIYNLFSMEFGLFSESMFRFGRTYCLKFVLMMGKCLLTSGETSFDLIYGLYCYFVNPMSLTYIKFRSKSRRYDDVCCIAVNALCVFWPSCKSDCLASLDYSRPLKNFVSFSLSSVFLERFSFRAGNHFKVSLSCNCKDINF